MADYVFNLTIKEEYIENSLIYIPKALGLSSNASMQEKVQALRQALYEYCRKLYQKGASKDAIDASNQLREDAQISETAAAAEALQALTD